MGKATGALKGAAAGGTAGAAFGPWGAGIGALGGGLLGYLSSDDGSAAANKQAAFDANIGDLSGLSNDMDARRKAALHQAWGQFGPVDNVLSKMYGPGAMGPGIDIDALFGPNIQNGAYDPAAFHAMTEGKRDSGEYWDPARGELRETRIKTVNRNLERSQLNKGPGFQKGTRIKR